MWKYLKLHEAFIRGALAGDHGSICWPELYEFHAEQIRYMQHERLVHLLVTLFVAVFWMMTLGFVFGQRTIAGLAAVALLLVLLVAYLIHYFRMENGIQRWYHLQNRITEKMGKTGACYEGNKVESHLPR
ncbi:MAG: hypothetical protein A2289_05770 [Deltaproteobacteria bacterium RIFOXYA12_FULL_58_15]|nr:MAG: hypothetical protein A2289_05770 [Deltaproteobacteria bacterium RIFOXYA12_FULL_58_15]OGR13961.1 MAG: hypothetical protein A2341_04535 [Deltaproteobacteria bacterium RIFOXYB12_FULL_58_9]